MYENSTISLADARSRFDPLNVLGFRYSFVWVIGILNQLRLRVGVSMLIRPVVTYVETVTCLLFVFGCTQN
jgi:hypothetical protein